MKITRTADQTTMQGPETWFTGQVYVDALAAPEDDSRVSASLVHFAPGARTAWHTHPHGQTIYVTEGIGRVQKRGGEIMPVHPGDRVFFEAGEEHWHGAAADRFMVHIAMLQVGEDGSSAEWGDHVTDTEYAGDS